ncbi:ferritin-like fold-containing protein [Parafrankia elaeagni]|uniref:ferritin-like fold-containing protein n=1 Tax=Parafrankia elaeagni TaxID=222534 RepID=UPI00037C2E32|nr:ferritin-like fold-containing protein [Parafrankia elaeagni]
MAQTSQTRTGSVPTSANAGTRAAAPTADATGEPVTPGAADPALVDLLGLLAFGELTAFERMATDARMAPALADKIALGRMAAAEFAHFEAIERELTLLGVDMEQAMTPFVPALTAFHNLTAPSDWLESLVKAYVGDSIAADFYREIAGRLEPGPQALVLSVLADAGHAAFAVDRVRAAIDSNPAVAGRLALWARRLVGEALTQAQRVAVDRDALTSLLAGVGDLEQIAAIFNRIMAAHGRRMSALGLSA